MSRYFAFFELSAHSRAQRYAVDPEHFADIDERKHSVVCIVEYPRDRGPLALVGNRPALRFVFLHPARRLSASATMSIVERNFEKPAH